MASRKCRFVQHMRTYCHSDRDAYSEVDVSWRLFIVNVFGWLSGIKWMKVGGGGVERERDFVNLYFNSTADDRTLCVSVC